MADDQPTPEQWRPVVGYEGFYEVSDHGRVRSLDRMVTRQATGVRLFRRGMMLRGTPNGSGHLKVDLRRDGERSSRFVHRLVLEAFVGPCPDGSQCCHWNDVPDDNRLSNLRWDTPSQNLYDCVRNGKHSMARKVRCIRGHEFTPENTYRYVDGRRGCRECKKIRKARAAASRRSEIVPDL